MLSFQNMNLNVKIIFTNTQTSQIYKAFLLWWCSNRWDIGYRKVPNVNMVVQKNLLKAENSVSTDAC